MDLSTLLSPDCTRCAVDGSSKKKVLELIGQLAAPRLSGTTSFDVFESLLNRERLGSTGIGMGVAIPHGRLASANKPVAVLFTLSSPIDFDAIDNQPVDIIFALLVPEDQHEQHLQTLASVAQRLNDKNCTRALRDAHSDQELYDLFTG
ncbi:PTS IIA-like nitrogen regulatory protein PtsN [Pseudidiomarina andamanensis]|uniref:PTS IIA-like nitrogen-regulatory protein PtsN n=1 Tax=Pseudidiomarina andamanensis TaxID=1940690 RepID=A0AA92EUP6_9GAMM|nr:PTS IIA-like nitrogen regulatory protein PtsN [Pseudidiomarina andamanensis]MDS0217562.1 PTS IIA-like nitrogen regulatory protein PtsN [Pseudidiomarina andamanensis]QGT96559.1 PTS IIA-like nitrogen-regulatory protein PtsN [Pseudidiomarina andamanensis]